MQIMYIDESGDTLPISQKGKKFLALTGCIINENDIPKIESKLRDIKTKFSQRQFGDQQFGQFGDGPQKD